MRLFFLCFFAVFLCLPLRGEEPVLQVQRELRARKYYFGEIDGKASEETVAAIGKFQLAKGIDKTGNLDAETLRALDLPAGTQAASDEAHALDAVCDFVLRYWQVRESNDWERVAPFYAGEVVYYSEGILKLSALRERSAEDNRRWPGRKFILLNRIASLLPERSDTAQVTARVRTQAAGNSSPARALTEDLIFRLRKTEKGWRIIAVKLLE